MITVMPDQIGNTVVAAGLYWQQSKWDGRKCVPCILELFDTDTLRMGVADAIVFAVPAREVAAKLTVINQLALTIGTEKYTISGLGTTRSPEFAPVMLDYLRATGSDAATRHGENGVDELYLTALRVADPGPFTMGKRATASMAADGMAAKARIEPWGDLLRRAGARVD